MIRTLPTSRVSFFKLAAAICLVALGFAGRTLAQPALSDADQHAARTSGEAVTQILGMIPESIESILVVRRTHAAAAPRGRTIVETRVVDGRAVLVAVDERGQPVPIYQQSFEEMSLAFNAHLLGKIDHGRFAHRWLKPEKLTATVFAARNFQDGERGQSTSCDGCLFVVFAEPIASAASDALPASAEAVQDAAGSRFIKVPVDQRLGTETPQATGFIFLQQAGPKLLIAANSLDLLKLIDSTRRAGRRAWATATEEWKYVNRDAPIWALRHYRPETARSSATSLLGVDPTAVGMTATYDPGRGNRNVITRYLSRGAQAEAAIRKFYPRDIGRPVASFLRRATIIDVVFPADIREMSVHPMTCFETLAAPLGFWNQFYSY